MRQDLVCLFATIQNLQCTGITSRVGIVDTDDEHVSRYCAVKQF